MNAGHYALFAYPNPTGSELVDAALGLWEQDLDGAGVNAGVFFTLDGDLPEGVLVSPLESVELTSPVQLIDVDDRSPEEGRRFPVEVAFHQDGGPFGAPRLLSVVPLQGRPLRPHTRYAVVVLRALGDATDAPLGVSLDVVQAAHGEDAAGWPDDVEAELARALPVLVGVGIAPDDIAGWTVFRTGDPVAQAAAVTEVMRTDHRAEGVPVDTEVEVYDKFCVLEGRIRFPQLQSGTPPFHASGGRWVLDDDGRPVVQGTEDARLFITLPREEMTSPLPTAVFIRTGGGGDRPLIDRGVRAEPGGEAVEPGTGLAVQLAEAGFAGVMVDGPHGGLRNADGGDEQFLIFNFLNFPALRDNLRQSALELALLPDVLAPSLLTITDCPGASVVGGGLLGLDTDNMVLIGHSMGATIAPLVAALEPRYRALILSGAGGSWIENIVYKQSPVAVRPLAELILGYEEDRHLHRHDPILSVVQAAGDPADPLAYLRTLRGGDGPHVLMIQGVVDTYILPPIANATSLGLELDLAGPALDEDEPELADFAPLGSLLPLAGAETTAYPAEGNRGAATRVVVQHLEDGVEDGHEVMFQTEGPKRQIVCFLRSFAAGEVPVVVDPAAGCD